MRRISTMVAVVLTAASAVFGQSSRTVTMGSPGQANAYVLQNRSEIVRSNLLAVAAGDLSGTASASTVTGLRGHAIAAPAGAGDTGKAYIWNGSAWVLQVTSSAVNWGAILGTLSNQTDLWAQLTNRYTKAETAGLISTARVAYAATAGTSVYATAAGELADGEQDPVFGLYATFGESWTQRNDFATTISDIPPMVYDGKMWVLGGAITDGGGTVIDDVYSSDDGETWTLVTAAPGWVKRGGHVGLEYDGKMWVMGGINVSPPGLNDVWWTTNGVNWVQATNNAAWGRRWSHSGMVYDNKMWVMGGNSSGGLKRDVWWSTNGANWTLATNTAAWSARITSGASFAGKMWIISGWAGSSSWPTDAWWSTNGANWNYTPAPWTGRYYPMVAQYHNQLWFVMGDNFYIGQPKRDAWVTTDGSNWFQTAADIPQPKGGAAMVEFKDKMYIIGGGAYGANYKTVWNAYPQDDVVWKGWLAYQVTASGYMPYSGTSDYATVAGYANTAGTSAYATAAGYADTAGTSSYATAAGYASIAGMATNALTAGYATNAGNASTAGYATNAGYAATAGTSVYATAAGYAATAGTSVYATTAGALAGGEKDPTVTNRVRQSVTLAPGGGVNQFLLQGVGGTNKWATYAAVGLVTQNQPNVTLGSGFDVVDKTLNGEWLLKTGYLSSTNAIVNLWNMQAQSKISSVIASSPVPGRFLQTDGSAFNQWVALTWVPTAGTSYFATVAGYASTAGYATNAGNASTAGYATNAGYADIAGTSVYATASGYADTAGTSVYATASGYAAIAGYATNAGYASIAGYATNSAQLGGVPAADFVTNGMHNVRLGTNFLALGVSLDALGVPCFDYTNRTLYSDIGGPTVVWGTGLRSIGLYDAATNLSVDWSNRALMGVGATNNSIDWQNGEAYEPDAAFPGKLTLDWFESRLVGEDGNPAVVWSNRLLSGTWTVDTDADASNEVVNWRSMTGYVAVASVSYAGTAGTSDAARVVIDSGNLLAVDGNARQLIGTDGVSTNLDWQSKELNGYWSIRAPNGVKVLESYLDGMFLTEHLVARDFSNVVAASLSGRFLYDTNGNTSAKWGVNELWDGSQVVVNWKTGILTNLEWKVGNVADADFEVVNWQCLTGYVAGASVSYAAVAGYATNALTAGYATNAGNASTAGYATNAGYAAIAGYATNAGYASIAGLATNALELGGVPAAAYWTNNSPAINVAAYAGGYSWGVSSNGGSIVAGFYNNGTPDGTLQYTPGLGTIYFSYGTEYQMNVGTLSSVSSIFRQMNYHGGATSIYVEVQAGPTPVAAKLCDPVTGETRVDWMNSLLVNGGTTRYDWSLGRFYNAAGSNLIDLANTELKDLNGTPALNWQNHDLRDYTNHPALDWANRQLQDYDGITTVPTLLWASGELTNRKWTVANTATAGYEIVHWQCMTNWVEGKGYITNAVTNTQSNVAFTYIDTTAPGVGSVGSSTQAFAQGWFGQASATTLTNVNYLWGMGIPIQVYDSFDMNNDMVTNAQRISSTAFRFESAAPSFQDGTGLTMFNGNRALVASDGATTNLNWEARELLGYWGLKNIGTGNYAMRYWDDTVSVRLDIVDVNNVLAGDLMARKLYGPEPADAINWYARTLNDTNGAAVVDWKTGWLTNAPGATFTSWKVLSVATADYEIVNWQCMTGYVASATNLASRWALYSAVTNLNMANFDITGVYRFYVTNVYLSTNGFINTVGAIPIVGGDHRLYDSNGNVVFDMNGGGEYEVGRQGGGESLGLYGASVTIHTNATVQDWLQVDGYVQQRTNDWHYWGSESVDDSWRMGPSSTNFVVQVRVGGTWTNAVMFTRP